MENVPANRLRDYQVGMRETHMQTITDEDVRAFAKISGDHNPVHLDEAYCLNTRYKKRIAHGLISAGFFSAIFGTKLPGNGCVYVAQDLKFKRPVYIGDTVTAEVVLQKIDEARGRLFFDTTCYVDGKVVISGTAEIYLPE
ncbi:MAG: MaoC family dehydratase [Formosimonas sp.]